MTRSRAGALVSRRLAALIDQGIVSAVNFAGFVLSARELSPAVWGAFGFAYAAVVFAQGFQRAIIIIPMITFSAEQADWRDSKPAWAAINLRLAIGSTMLAVALGIVASSMGNEWALLCASMTSVMMLPLFLMEFVRRSTIQDERFGRLIGISATYAVGVALCLWAWPSTWAFDWALPSALALGAVGSITVGVVGRPGLPVGTRYFSWPSREGYTKFSFWSCLSHLGFSGYNFGIQSLLAVGAGPGALGVFHACRMLIQPVQILVGAMDGVDKPGAARAYAASGREGLFRSLQKSFGVTVTVSIAYLIVLAFVDERLLHIAYGTKYAAESSVVWLWGIVAIMMVIAQPIESGLYVIRHTRAMFVSRLTASVASIGAAWWLITTHGAAGALIGMAIGYATTALLGLMILRRRA